jgi:hypothetical protein
VIWLVFRRYRMLMAITVLALAALAVWMLLQGHASDVAESSPGCRYGGFPCTTRSGIFSLSDQATAINFLLLLIPCLLGVVFGAPLVAGELEHVTNRLAWTQGITRTKWLLFKWALVAMTLLVFVVALTFVAQWWTGHTDELQDLNLFLIGTGRLQPLYFPVTGLALAAYTLFAFALGAALGAVIRKTSWAIFGTLVVYTAVSVFMVLVVRPSLAPQVFLPVHLSATGQGFGDSSNSIAANSWNLGSGYRYAPGTPATASLVPADTVELRCEDRLYSTSSGYFDCLSDHHVQFGTFYQPGDRYWELQWRESALLIITAGALFGVTVWSVRRWRA